MDDITPDVSLVPTIVVDSQAIGEVANQAALHTLLQDYQARKSDQTLRRQRADIALFERFLGEAGLSVAGMDRDLSIWSVVTWGLAEAFNRWQLGQGYATGSINVRLATVKAYCQLAAKAGYLSNQEYTLVKSVAGFRQKEARNVDEKRPVTRQPHAKKAEPVDLSPVHAVLLKSQPVTPQGRSDALLMCLLLDHGLRVGEIAGLDVGSVNLATGKLTFYRHKVDLVQEHDLTPDTWRAAQAYLGMLPAQGPLFVGKCSKERVNERTLNHRVGQLGKAIGLIGLSPHDCRHYWATDALRNGTDVKSLQDAGGWASPAMPLRYAASSKVANAGVKLSATSQRRKESLDERGDFMKGDMS